MIRFVHKFKMKIWLLFYLSLKYTLFFFYAYTERSVTKIGWCTYGTRTILETKFVSSALYADILTLIESLGYDMIYVQFFFCMLGTL